MTSGTSGMSSDSSDHAAYQRVAVGVVQSRAEDLARADPAVGVYECWMMILELFRTSRAP